VNNHKEVVVQNPKVVMALIGLGAKIKRIELTKDNKWFGGVFSKRNKIVQGLLRKSQP